jgi:hypothetical protein
MKMLVDAQDLLNQLKYVGPDNNMPRSIRSMGAKRKSNTRTANRKKKNPYEINIT